MPKVKGSAPVAIEWHPSAVHGIEVASRVVWKFANKHLVVTGAQEEGHSEKSLHYGIPGDIRCRAFDIRTSDFSKPQIKDIVAELKLRLCAGKEFDVVLEDDHIHVEAQPH